MPKLVAFVILVWRLATRDELSSDRDPNNGKGHWNRVAPGGRGDPARRNWTDRGTGRRLSLGGVWVLPGGLEPSNARRRV